ncbi:hypothetical protein EVC24_026 [Rhizobium phage RHph_I4]|nr:hypothetical protein EVC24_026 [Rhizobium phage RHph_I4]
MIDPLTIGPHELGFSWIDNTGKYHCWMTGRMEKYAVAKLTPVSIEVDHDYAQHVRIHNGIEKHRLDRITPQVIAQKPVIYIELGDGSHKLVDGNHRFLKASMLGWSELPGYLFHKALADEFKLDVPDHLNEAIKRMVPSFSGIY